MTKTREEWLQNFVEMNGRQPSLDEYMAAEKNWEFSTNPEKRPLVTPIAGNQDTSRQEDHPWTIDDAASQNQNQSGETPNFSWDKQNSNYIQEGSNNPSIGWLFLSIFIPIVGLVLWLVWRKDKPRQSKYARNGFFIGLVLSILLAISSVVLWFMLTNSANDRYGRDNVPPVSSSSMVDEDSDWDDSADASWDEASKTFTTDKGVLRINKIVKTTDYEGDPAVKVYFTLTNKQKENQRAYTIFSTLTEIQQKTDNTSNSLSSTSQDFDDDEEDHLFDNINPDGKISGFSMYKLENEDDPIVIQFEENYNPVATYEIPLD